SYLLRGVAEVQQEAFADAQADFATALDLDSSDAVRYAVFHNRGRLWLRQGKLTEALAGLEKAVALRPKECQTHLLLARAFQQQKRFADARQECGTAVQLRPDLPLVHRAFGELLWERGDLDTALRQFETAIRLEPASRPSPSLVSGYLECGGIRYSQGRFHDALAAYDAALRLCPDHGLAHHLRGEALLALKRLPEAERAFGQCLKHRPGYGPALRGRGSARVQLGDYAGAVEDDTQAAQ